MPDDIREFLTDLERNGQLLRVKEEIDPLDDMGAFIARADYNHLDKAILFENPKGFDIPCSPTPLVDTAIPASPPRSASLSMAR